MRVLDAVLYDTVRVLDAVQEGTVSSDAVGQDRQADWADRQESNATASNTSAEPGTRRARALSLISGQGAPAVPV